MLRWPVVERVWLPSWLASADAVLDRLVAAVDAAPAASAPSRSRFPTAAVESFKGVAALRSSVTASVAVPAAPPRPDGREAGRRPKPAGPAALDGETPFVPWIPKPAGDKAVLDELPAAKAARAVRRVLTAGSRPRGRSTSTGWPS